MILTIIVAISLLLLLAIKIFYTGKLYRKIIILGYNGLGLILLLEITIRSFKINYPALTTSYDVLIFFTFLIFILLSILSIKNFGPRKLYILSDIFILITLVGAVVTFSDVTTTEPILQSNLLVVHVLFSFLGEALLFISFIASIINLKRDFIYKTTLVGYIFYTFGALILGSIWAYFAWGSFWNWDSKELWALITFLIYTIILHTKKHLRIINILGFIASLITFIGVNYFMSSMHSYISV